MTKNFYEVTNHFTRIMNKILESASSRVAAPLTIIQSGLKQFDGALDTKLKLKKKGIYKACLKLNLGA